MKLGIGWTVSDAGKFAPALVPAVDVTSVFFTDGFLKSPGLSEGKPRVGQTGIELSSVEAALHDSEKRLLDSGIVSDTLLTLCHPGTAGDNISPDCSEAGFRETREGVLVSR